MYRRCAAILRSDEAARDAVQEVFLRVIERRGQYRGDASPATWLYAVATLHCLQQLRDQAGRIAKLAQLAEQPRDTPARSPEERLAIAKLLDGESDDVRLMVYLHYVDGMTLDEVAEVVGFSRKTVSRGLDCLVDIFAIALGDLCQHFASSGIVSWKSFSGRGVHPSSVD